MKNKILKISMSIIGIIFIISVCCLDSKYWIFFTTLTLISGILLSLFAYANNFFGKSIDK